MLDLDFLEKYLASDNPDIRNMAFVWSKAIELHGDNIAPYLEELAIRHLNDEITTEEALVLLDAIDHSL